MSLLIPAALAAKKRGGGAPPASITYSTAGMATPPATSLVVPMPSGTGGTLLMFVMTGHPGYRRSSPSDANWTTLQWRHENDMPGSSDTDLELYRWDGGAHPANATMVVDSGITAAVCAVAMRVPDTWTGTLNTAVTTQTSDDYWGANLFSEFARAPQITTTVNGCLLIHGACFLQPNVTDDAAPEAEGSWSNPVPFAKSFNTTNTLHIGCVVSTRVQATAGTTGNQSTDDIQWHPDPGATRQGISFMVALEPA